MIIRATLLALTLATGSNCALVAEHAPTLGEVLYRVDVPRLLECRDAGGGDPKRIAACLGAEALTQGLQIALDKAIEKAEEARASAHPGAGAADLTELDRDRLALELDRALDELAAQIAHTHGV